MTSPRRDPEPEVDGSELPYAHAEDRFGLEIAIEREAGRTGAVTAPDRSFRRDAPKMLQEDLRVVWDRGNDLRGAPTALGDGNRDALLVDVRNDKP